MNTTSTKYNARNYDYNVNDEIAYDNNEVDFTPKAISDFFLKVSLIASGLMTIVGFNLHRVEETVFLLVAIACISVSALCAITRVKIESATKIKA